MTPKQQTPNEYQLAAALLALWLYVICMSAAIHVGR